MLRRHPPDARRLQRGLSLVEMMVGIAVGLIVVSAAALLVGSQLGDNRRLLLETQVQQDLRAAADIVTRDLRRAGAWTDTARVGLWTAGAAPQPNPYAAMTPASGVATQVDYGYYRNPSAPTVYGFRLNNGVLQTFLGGGWQDLTDARAVRITAFDVDVRQEPPPGAPALRAPCPNDCPGGGDACWPTVTVREVTVDIAGQSVADAAVQRSLRTVVRLRNDDLQGACP
ncbi:MAG: prepilin-type N-terminal cleavage/methylation domain-containing protein [Rubrivivax sp.]|jgi:type IV pilus assembly protein PilW|nr:prepilin-type N-terminal cleavage/methylation domain-containing protein [Rubrivivax sp.]